MAVETEICNRALSLVGKEDIVNLNDQYDQVAIKCKAHFVAQLEATLRDHEWNCAKARDQITQVSATPPFGFAYSYLLPNDCLRPLRIHDSDEAWQREGRYILTDQSAPLNLHYIRNITNYSELDPDIVDAFEIRLASRFARVFLHDAAMGRSYLQDYILLIEQAKANDGQEGSTKKWRGTGRYRNVRNGW